MHGSQKCCGELVELIVDDIWQIANAGDQELWRLARSIIQRGTTELGAEENDGLSQQDCTAVQASACHHASAKTDHAHIFGSL